MNQGTEPHCWQSSEEEGEVFESEAEEEDIEEIRHQVIEEKKYVQSTKFCYLSFMSDKGQST